MDDSQCQSQSQSDGIDSNSCAGSSSARYKLMSPAKLPISRSPCITIPPGLSPSSFLESPVFLSNMKAEPSPTTGSFFKSQLIQFSGSSSGFSVANCSSSTAFDEGNNVCFEFKPRAGSHVFGLPAATHMTPGMNTQTSETFAQFQAQCVSQPFESVPSVKTEMVSSSKQLKLQAPVHLSASTSMTPTGTDYDEFNVRLPLDAGEQALQSHPKDIGPPVAADRSSDDGYNWRKYGQKLVKGCEFPRSYYKCTHPKCDVKKIFERSYDGQIKEIVYKGTHDHPKPQSARRFTAGAIMSNQEKTDKVSAFTAQEDKSPVNSQMSFSIEPNGTPEHSPPGTNDDSVEGAAPQLNSTNDDFDDDDPFSKRRKLDGFGTDITSVVKPVREARVVVQTTSEVDVLDDGYRWRKYGQKVVRGNPNPRSYYKCTNAGCQVRKHVERASHDAKAVITTYEGKHNHDVPAARTGTGSNDMAGPATANEMPRVRTEESRSISLDLGVGISSRAENRYNEQPIQHLQNHDKVFQTTPVFTHYGVPNGGIAHGSAENRSFQTLQLNHSSNPYPQNLERVLLGP